MSNVNSSRSNNFDFIRIAAAFSVLFSHQYALMGIKEPSILNVHSLGGLSILIFFSISGFLVSQSFDLDPNAWRFLFKRFLRIWPALAVVIIITSLVLGPLITNLTMSEYFAHENFIKYFKNLYFSTKDILPLEFSGNALQWSLNGSLWTIPLEVKCYLLLAFVGSFGAFRNKYVIPTLFFILALVYFWMEPNFGHLIESSKISVNDYYLFQFSIFFMAGACFYKLKIHENFKLALALLVIGWILGGIAVLFLKPILALFFVVPITTLFLGNLNTDIINRAGRYGDISYGIYIYAFPVQQTFIWLWKDAIPWWLLLFFVLITTTIFAFLSWHLIEKKALKLKGALKKYN